MPDDVTNPPLTWLFAILALAVIVGPFVYAFLKRDRFRAPAHEDQRGDLGWVALMRERLKSDRWF